MEEPKRKKYKERSAIFAAFYNLIAPGLGYFYIGKFRFAILFAFLYPFLFILTNYISDYLPAKTNSIFFLVCYSILFIIPVAHVAFYVRKEQLHRIYILQKYNRVLLYMIFAGLTYVYTEYLKDLTYEIHRIPSESMQNTLQIGDRVLVKYNWYGIYDSFSGKRLFNFHTPKKNEIVVYSADEDGYRGLFLKRIIGEPRDTIHIIERTVFINGIQEIDNINFKYDNIRREREFVNWNIYPKGAKWNEENYGPIYLPAKNDIVKIDSNNIVLWKPVIIREQNQKLNKEEKEILIGKILANGEYEVKNNYYFMLGDNRTNSWDSRYTGLISEEEILGRVEFLVYNPDDWERMGRILK
jgi:signal peptidase I